LEEPFWLLPGIPVLMFAGLPLISKVIATEVASGEA
jgi:hypothetical protein